MMTLVSLEHKRDLRSCLLTVLPEVSTLSGGGSMAPVERSEAARLLPIRLHEHSLTQRDLEEKLDAASGLAARWASGQRVPTTIRAIRIEELLGIPVRLWAVPAKRSRKAA